MTTSHGGAREAASRSGVQAIDRAAAILRCFSPQTPELGISEIAVATGLSTSTAHRLLAALQHNRLVRQTTHRHYALGPLFVQLARDSLQPTSLREAALGPMRKLRDLADETVGLHELQSATERTVVDQVESRQSLRRTYTEIGEPIPLPHGAPGKVLLAFQPHAAREQVLTAPLRPVTPTTITDPGTLREQLARIRETGCALSYAERTPGIRTVAAPIFDHAGRAVACLSLTGPEIRMPHQRMEELAPEVMQAAWAVSEALGATRESVERHLALVTDPASAPG